MLMIVVPMCAAMYAGAVELLCFSDGVVDGYVTVNPN
jgi:hypothetical protein